MPSFVVGDSYIEQVIWAIFVLPRCFPQLGVISISVNKTIGSKVASLKLGPTANGTCFTWFVSKSNSKLLASNEKTLSLQGKTSEIWECSWFKNFPRGGAWW